MNKQEYIKEIIELINKCDDLSLLYIVSGLLKKCV